ncbi:conjugal transfer protein [Streptomyces sp. NPDC006251]|uniref:conjugal transfer protein n=1 Tax=Streptomyces sp. NPDC006251 TaxID=3155718 RepID=UPI0033B6842F
MKLRRRRTAADGDWDEAAVLDEPAAPHAAEDDETGWQASVAGLSGMARLARVGIWVVIIAGPLLGSAALLSSAAPSQGVAKTAPETRQASAIGPSGFAQLFVAAYLEAGEGTEQNLAPYYAGSVTLTHAPGTRTATRTAAISAREVSPGYWSVTVAASIAAKTSKDSYRDAGVQYYQVAVQALGPRSAGGPSATESAVGYTAVSLPAQVAAPEALRPGDLGYGTSRGSGASDPATQTAAAFLNAFLAGDGELDRYTSPGVELQPVTPAPYAEVKITGVEDNSGDSAEQSVPADGAKRRLLVTVDATDSDGNTFPLTYALTLQARAGRWEISALDDAPALGPSSTPSAVAGTPSPDSDDSATDSPSPSVS